MPAQEIGVKLDRSLRIFRRYGKGEIHQSLRLIRLDRERLFKALLRFFLIAERPINLPTENQRPHILRIQRQRALNVIGGFLKLRLTEAKFGGGSFEVRAIGSELERLVEQFLSGGEISLIVFDNGAKI